jgi:hypothetical protein
MQVPLYFREDAVFFWPLEKTNVIEGLLEQ